MTEIEPELSAVALDPRPRVEVIECKGINIIKSETAAATARLRGEIVIVRRQRKSVGSDE